MNVMRFSILLVPLLIYSSYSYCDSESEPFSNNITATFTVNAPDRITSIYDQSIKINSAGSLNELSQITIPVNEHFWNMKVLKAETIKSDGRHIAVPDDKIIATALPNAPALGAFEADIKTTTIIFPDVAVGDTIHFIVRKEQTSAIFPGGFSVIIKAPYELRYHSYTVNLDTPENMNIQVQDAGFSSQSENTKDRKIITWKLQPQTYESPELGSVSPFERSPHLIISDFKDWNSIADTFEKMADPMSMPTQDIQKLADTITANIIDRREQVRAIFDWVSINIRYFNIELGDGGYVPHSASAIVINMYGDCKDHVTLMRALLKAKNIDSNYALTSLEPYYQDNLTPTIAWFNHIILFIPELNIFTDPTAAYSSFDNILPNEADKPVLLIKDNRGEIVRTPAMSVSENRISSESEFYYSSDKNLKGSQKITATGPIAAFLRRDSMIAQQQGSDDFIKTLLGRQHWHGVGKIIHPQPNINHLDPYSLSLELELTTSKDFLGHSNMVLPVGIDLYHPPYIYFINYQENEHKENFTCYPENYIQITRLHLPNGWSVTNLPSGSRIKTQYISYSSTYEIKNGIIYSKRDFSIDIKHEECNKIMTAEMYPDLIKIKDDFLYHPKFSSVSHSVNNM